MTLLSDEKLLETINTLIEHQAIFFGPQGFKLAKNLTELAEAQIGFAVTKEGFVFSDDAPGNWQKSWRVIATDTELGDPYFVDLNKPNLPVFTAVAEEKENHWQLTQVAYSLTSFYQCLMILYKQGEQTQSLFVPDEHTLMSLETLETLEKELKATSQAEEYWFDFFEGYFDWLDE